MDHAQLCAEAANALAAVPAKHRPDVVVGLDGFIDSIIAVVATRHSTSSYQAMATISQFGDRVAAAAGKSTAFELVVQQRKIGGNGPIMANALACLDYQVTAVGVLGEGAIDPVFDPLVKRAKHVISLGQSAATDACEFADGKIMLCKSTPLDQVTYARLIERVGVEPLRKMLREAAGVAMVNWTMVLGMTEIWQRLASDVLPGLRQDRPRWFIDLADPAKRTVEDIRGAFAAMQAMQKHIDVVLGMNDLECRQVLAALDEPWPTAATEHAAAELGCKIVRDKLGIAFAVCHLVKSAAVAWRGGSASAVGFFAAKPVITTGAGDHFNAGFFAALLAGLAPLHCIQVGAATSGLYVRSALSPSRAQVCAFLQEQSAVR